MSWVKGSSNKSVWYGVVLALKKEKKNPTFLSSNIDEQSEQPYVLDRVPEEEDDAYNFSTDYV